MEAGELPKISVTFPDGTQDSLILSHTFGNAADCTFLGHLQNDLKTCVAVTGCPGKDDLMITLAGERGGLFKLGLDGLTEDTSKVK